jgi:hypothetical protein
VPIVNAERLEGQLVQWIRDFKPDVPKAGATGLEPATSAVTGQRSNQLSYAPAMTLQQAAPEAPAQYAKAGRSSGIRPRIGLARAGVGTRGTPAPWRPAENWLCGQSVR